jgi:hypothetical protein
MISVTGLALNVVLAAICALGRYALAFHVSPWAGVFAAILSFWIWGRFGPSPTRGQASGILRLCGYASILGALVLLAILATR